MLVEFRIPLPIQVTDFEVAQLYMIIKLQEDVTGGGEGILVLKNEPFDNLDGHMGISPISGVEVPKMKGQYTLKHYLLASMVPSFIKKLVPKDSLYLIEESWNCHPYCLTVLTNGYFSKEKFNVVVESKYVDTDGSIENIMNLNEKQLKKRERIILDMAQHAKKESVKPSEDVTKWHSEKRNIGPLEEKWYEKSTLPHIMWCYKNVTVTCKYFGLQTIVEALVKKQQEMIFKRSMCQMIVLMDEWSDLTLEQIRQMEDETQKKLVEKIHQGEVCKELQEQRELVE